VEKFDPKPAATNFHLRLLVDRQSMTRGIAPATRARFACRSILENGSVPCAGVSWKRAQKLGAMPQPQRDFRSHGDPDRGA